MKILIVDNYDSFTYNLFQYIAELAHIIPQVFYNNTLTYAQFKKIKPDGVIISPGPGNPTKKSDFGISQEIIQRAEVPVFGVCLGHQGIGAYFGANVVTAPVIMHGRSSNIFHTGRDVFKNIPQGFAAIRYHSLIVESLSSDLQKTAWTKEGVIMGIKHIKKPLWGVQFHPESIGTQYGKEIIKNFLNLVKE